MAHATVTDQDMLNASVPTDRQPSDAVHAPIAPIQPVLSSTAARLELSSSAAAAPQDRLSSMLPELLSYVFVLSNYRKPISGSLLSYTRTNRYRFIRLNSSKELQALCDTIAMDARLGALVRTLRQVSPPLRRTTPVPRFFDRGHFVHQVYRSEDRDPTRQEIVRLCRSLTHVEKVRLDGRFVNLILSHDIASSCFPRLRTLELYNCFEQHRDPLNVARWACLEHYPELRALTVSVPSYWRFGGRGESDESEGQDEEEEKDGESQEEEGVAGESGDHSGLEGEGRGSVRARRDDTRPGQQPSQSPPVACTLRRIAGTPFHPFTAWADADDPVFGSITELDFSGRLDAPGTLPFIENFQSVTRLYLDLGEPQPNADDIYPTNFTPILSHYNRATFIQHLSLNADMDEQSLSEENSGWKGLERFTALTSLDLDVDTCGLDFFQHLHDPLPLEHLVLCASESRLPPASLTALLRPGRSRLTTLETLTLDGIRGQTGTRVKEIISGLVPGINILKPDLMWHLSDRLRGIFKLEKAENLVKLAEEQGVRVLGQVLQVIKLQRQRNVELQLAASWDDNRRDEENETIILQVAGTQDRTTLTELLHEATWQYWVDSDEEDE